MVAAKEDLEQADGKAQSLQPMQWESSKVELGPGADMNLPIPLVPERARQGETVPRWKHPPLLPGALSGADLQ